MTVTTYMQLPFIEATQNQKEVTHGDGLTLHEKWHTTPLTKDFAAGNISLTATEWRENQRVLCTNVDVVGRTLTFPASSRGSKVVVNDPATSSVTLILIKGSTSINLPVGSAAVVFMDATTNGLDAVIGGVQSGFTVASLVPTEPFFGARVHRSVDSANVPANTITELHLIATTAGLGWDTVDYDSGFPETSTRRPNFFLGNLTFDGSNAAVVVVGTDQIVINAHGKVTGMGPYTYSNGGGTDITGLTNNTNYWLIRVDDNNLKVATSRANALAGTAIDLTAVGTGTTHRLDGSGRFMIPTGVKRVQVMASMMQTQIATLTANQITFLKNGAAVAGAGVGGNQDQANATQMPGCSLVSSPLSVSAGDYFSVQTVTSANRPIEEDAGARTWFAIRVLEYDGAPAEQIEFDFLGTPANGSRVFKKVFSRKTIMNDEFANSRAHAGTAPAGGSVAFDIQRNAVSIGTMTFADAAATATFTTTAGAFETFIEGDRIDVIAPANLHGMADIAVNLWAWRSS